MISMESCMLALQYNNMNRLGFVSVPGSLPLIEIMNRRGIQTPTRSCRQQRLCPPSRAFRFEWGRSKTPYFHSWCDGWPEPLVVVEIVSERTTSSDTALPPEMLTRTVVTTRVSKASPRPSCCTTSVATLLFHPYLVLDWQCVGR